MKNKTISAATPAIRRSWVSNFSAKRTKIKTMLKLTIILELHHSNRAINSVVERIQKIIVIARGLFRSILTADFFMRKVCTISILKAFKVNILGPNAITWKKEKKESSDNLT